MILENYKQQCWSDTDWLYIQGLTKAIEDMSILYIRNNEEDDKRFHVEHVFAYELYHLWKDVLKKENPNSLMLNGELTKHYYCLEKEEYKFPDVVLHSGYSKSNYQCIICEIKSSRNHVNNDALMKDMKSLKAGIESLGYKCGVFIYLGDDTLCMISKIKQILTMLEFITQKRVLFVGINGEKTVYEII